MTEANTDPMKEFGSEYSPRTSPDYNLGKLAPKSYEHGQGGKSPEKMEQKPLAEWVNKVKESIQNGSGYAFVHDRTNFDIDTDGNVTPTRYDGYQDRLIRGQNFDTSKAEQVRRLMDGVIHNQRYENNQLNSTNAGLPRETERKDDTLYISIAQKKDFPQILLQDVPPIVEGKTVIELRYKQPRADESKRTAEKRVTLVLPNDIAENLPALIQSGIDPNALRDISSEIFTSETGSDWYDVNLIDWHSRPDSPEIKVKAEKPKLTETFLQVTKPGGQERQILAEKKIVKPSVSTETIPSVVEMRSNLNVVKPTEPEETPHQAKFREAEEKTSKLRTKYKNGEISKEALQEGLRKTIVTVDGVYWSQGVETGNWYKSDEETKKWVQAEPPIEPVQQSITQETQTTEADERWKDFGDIDWDNIGTSEGKSASPADVSEDQKNNWYRELANDWETRPQTKDYWIGNKDKGIEDKRSILQMAGMTDLEINDLVNNRTVKGGRPKTETDVRPEDNPVVNKSKEQAQKGARRKASSRIPPEGEDDIENSETATGILRQMLTQDKQRAEQERRRDKNLRNFYDAFAAAEFRQTRFSVHEFMNTPPLWYEELDRDLQSAVLSRIYITNAASEKRDGGPVKLEASIQHEGLRIEKRSLQGLWEKMPGWREAFLTTMRENFVIEQQKNGATLRLNPQAIEYFETHSIEDYYESLVTRLTRYFESNERYKDDPFMDDDRKRPDRTAVAAVASVRNLFFISGVFEFADKERKLKTDPALISEQFRVFFNPHAKAKDKLIKDPNSKSGKDRSIQEISGTEEGWGGPIGQLYAERFNYQHSNDFTQPRDPELRAKFLKGDSYFPTEMMVSFMDFVKFQEGQHKDKTLAEATLGILAQVQPDAFGLYNTDPGNIDFRQLRGEELWSSYQNTCDSAAQVYKLIVGKAEGDYNINKLIDALNLLKTDPRIRKIYTNDNLLHACIMMMAGGPLLFSSSGMARTPEQSYDTTINALLSDPRLYRLMDDEKNAKKRILKRLRADDTSSVSGALKSIFISGSTLVGERDRIRRAAVAEVNKYR